MTTWAPGRVASFSAGEWVVMVTDNGQVRIWRSPDVGFSMMEASAFDLRRLLGENRARAGRGGWAIQWMGVNVTVEYRPDNRTQVRLEMTDRSSSDLREGLGKALDAIHRHHHPESTLADFEAKMAQDYDPTVVP